MCRSLLWKDKLSKSCQEVWDWEDYKVGFSCGHAHSVSHYHWWRQQEAAKTFGISRKSLVGDFRKRTMSDATQPDKLLQQDYKVVGYRSVPYIRRSCSFSTITGWLPAFFLLSASGHVQWTRTQHCPTLLFIYSHRQQHKARIIQGICICWWLVSQELTATEECWRTYPQQSEPIPSSRQYVCTSTTAHACILSLCWLLSKFTSQKYDSKKPGILLSPSVALIFGSVVWLMNVDHWPSCLHLARKVTSHLSLFTYIWLHIIHRHHCHLEFVGRWLGAHL